MTVTAVPTLVVAKAFKSTQRRFHVGQEVQASDDFSPLAFDDLMAQGFVVEKAVELTF